MFKSLRLAVPLVALVLLVLGVSISLAAGGGPGDAVWADGAAQTVAPRSSLWFRFDYGGGKKEVDVTLDTNSAGLRLAVYTPQAVSAWQNGDSLKAVGSGSPVQNHTLGWSGQFPSAGSYYVVVTNDGDAPVTVQVKASGDNTTVGVVTAPPKPTPLSNPFAETTPIGQAIPGKLAFLDAQGGNLYTVGGSGNNLQRVSFGMDPQWNHAGTQIALARQGPVAGIYTLNADGGERLLYGTNEPRAPDWNPSDSQIVFSRQTAVKGGGEICFGARCFTLPAQSQWRLGLLNAGDGAYSDIPTTDHAFTPTWNSNGVDIAYNDTTLGIVKTQTSGTPSFIPFIGDLRPGVGTYDPLKILSPQYSPDGAKIIMMVAQPPTWQIAIANADGSDRRLLTSMNNLDFVHPNNVAPVWSPDGKQILFLSDRNGKWEIFVMNADGSNVQQVLKNITDQIPLTYNYQGERLLSWSK